MFHVYPASLNITVFTLSFGIPYLLTILALKFEIVHSITLLLCLSIAVCRANSVDPDQTPRFAASDLGLQCLHMRICSDA